MTKRAVFRTDSSASLGAGHLMRCLSLATELQRQGWNCHFMCRALAGNANHLVRRAGHRLTEWDAPVATSDDWLVDAAETRKIAVADRADWIVVDHYRLDDRWESAVAGTCGAIMVIDDLADRRHACDLLLDQTFGETASRYEALTLPGTRILAGASYCLLRPGFYERRESSLARRETANLERLLVSFGGTDPLNATTPVLDALDRWPCEMNVAVVMGASAPYLPDVRARASAMARPARVLVDVDDMASLMAEADLAIGAGGGSAWERCCLGLPSIIVVQADNQRAVATHLAEAGAALAISPDDLTSTLPTLLKRLLAEPATLRRMRDAASAITDGRGAQRVVQAMEHPHG